MEGRGRIRPHIGPFSDSLKKCIIQCRISRGIFFCRSGTFLTVIGWLYPRPIRPHFLAPYILEPILKYWKTFFIKQFRLYGWIELVKRYKMAYFFPSCETGQKFFYKPYFQEHWFLSTAPMFSDYNVLQKCPYDPVVAIWMDRARQGLQDGILLSLLWDWPKIFLQAILSRTLVSEHCTYVFWL